LHNGDLQNLNSSPDIIRKDDQIEENKMCGHTTQKEEMRNAYKFLVGKSWMEGTTWQT